MNLETLSRKIAAKFSTKTSQESATSGRFSKSPPKPKRRVVITPEEFEPGDQTELGADPLHLCLQLERYGFLLAHRDKWRGHPDVDRICELARTKLDDMFAIVPEGFASLPRMTSDEPGTPEITVDTASFLLARHAVSNANYQKFVDSGGYEQLDLWPEDMWPHLIDMKDLTGHSGPRYWKEGRYNKRLADHPVVGICQYEAMAYANWIGYRLPTEAEWQMAATWRIRSEANVLRRYPWGDALDINRCNIWSSGIGKTVPIHKYPNGAAPNHVLQLIGNVWEWTDAEFVIANQDGCNIVGEMRMAPIRGGAFDTYFPAQAAGTFRTGLPCLARMHNVGFRCARNLVDIKA